MINIPLGKALAAVEGCVCGYCFFDDKREFCKHFYCHKKDWLHSNSVIYELVDLKKGERNVSKKK